MKTLSFRAASRLRARKPLGASAISVRLANRTTQLPSLCKRFFSGEKCSMLAIGRSLMSKPELLLLDDPLKIFFLQIGQRDIGSVEVGEAIVFILDIKRTPQPLRQLVNEAEMREAVT